MKKLLLIALLVLSITVLAACGGSNEVVENTQPEVVNDPVDSSTETED